MEKVPTNEMQTQTPTAPIIQVVTPNTKSLTIDLWKAAALLGGAILVSVVGTAFTIGNTLNADHFTLQSTAQAVTDMKGTYVRDDVYQANQTALTSSLRTITNQLTDLNNKIGYPNSSLPVNQLNTQK